MVKDKVFAYTLYQTAKVVTVTTSYDNKFNRPETVQHVTEYPCRITRKNASYPSINSSNISINSSIRGYFEIDADIKSGSSIEIECIKYIVGLVYKPMNNNIEADLNIKT